jgi:hypothetical protein
MNSRSRRWGAPASDARNTPHSASNPSAARSPSTTPSPREARAATFSTNTNEGRTSPTIRENSDQSPDRSPPIPTRFPALLMSWQGKPPETRSTTPRHGRPSKVATSVHTGHGARPPSSIWRTRVAAAKASLSTKQTGRAPTASSPRASPPPPAKSSMERRATLTGSPRCARYRPRTVERSGGEQPSILGAGLPRPRDEGYCRLAGVRARRRRRRGRRPGCRRGAWLRLPRARNPPRHGARRASRGAACSRPRGPAASGSPHTRTAPRAT